MTVGGICSLLLLLLLLSTQNMQQSFAKLLERDPLLVLTLLTLILPFTTTVFPSKQTPHQQMSPLLEFQRVTELDQRVPVQPATGIDVVGLEHLVEPLLVRIR